MAWTRKLTPPLVLKDGRRLETLADVSAMGAILYSGVPVVMSNGAARF
jgi:hypothetical protein